MSIKHVTDPLSLSHVITCDEDDCERSHYIKAETMSAAIMRFRAKQWKVGLHGQGDKCPDCDLPNPSRRGV